MKPVQKMGALHKHYVITTEELTWLEGRVKVLFKMTQEVCEKKIARPGANQPVFARFKRNV